MSDTDSNSVIDLTESATNTESAPDDDGSSTVLNIPWPAQLEALLIVADQPVSAIDLATITGIPMVSVEETLRQLARDYWQQGRGFELRNIGGGWRFYSAEHCADLIVRYATDGRSAKLSQAALETLAVVAYKQPVSRARVGAIRGVSVDGVMRTLLNRGLVCEAGSDPTTAAVLYQTTPYFLERMGFHSLEELPPIEDHLPDMSVLDELVEPF